MQLPAFLSREKKHFDGSTGIASGWEQTSVSPRIDNHSSQLNAYTGWVAAVVDLVSRLCSSAAWSIHDASGPVHADHPALLLLARPSPRMTGNQLIAYTQASLDLHGDAYWRVIRDGDEPVELVELPAPEVKVLTPEDARLTVAGYRHRDRYGETQLQPDEVVHFRQTSPLSPAMYGTGTILNQGKAAAKLTSAGDLEQAYLENHGMPSLFLKSSKMLTTEQVMEVELQMKRSSAKRRSGGVKVINDFLDVVQVQTNLKDMSLDTMKQSEIKLLAAAFGLPYGLLDTSDQLKAGLDQMLEQANIFAIRPRLASMASTLSEHYLPLWDGTEGQDMHATTPLDDVAMRRERSWVLEAVQAGLISTQEGRARLGLKEDAP